MSNIVPESWKHIIKMIICDPLRQVPHKDGPPDIAALSSTSLRARNEQKAIVLTLKLLEVLIFTAREAPFKDIPCLVPSFLTTRSMPAKKATLERPLLFSFNGRVKDYFSGQSLVRDDGLEV